MVLWPLKFALRACSGGRREHGRLPRGGGGHHLRAVRDPTHSKTFQDLEGGKTERGGESKNRRLDTTTASGCPFLRPDEAEEGSKDKKSQARRSVNWRARAYKAMKHNTELEERLDQVRPTRARHRCQERRLRSSLRKILHLIFVASPNEVLHWTWRRFVRAFSGDTFFSTYVPRDLRISVRQLQEKASEYSGYGWQCDV